MNSRGKDQGVGKEFQIHRIARYDIIDTMKSQRVRESKRVSMREREEEEEITLPSSAGAYFQPSGFCTQSIGICLIRTEDVSICILRELTI